MASGSASRDLTRAEQSYAAQVGYQLRHEPEARQHQLLQQVRKTLLTGVPVDTYSRLEREFGAPADFAHRVQGAALATRGAAGNIYIERQAKARLDGDINDPDETAPSPAPSASGGSNTALWIIAALIVIMVVAVVIVIAL